MQPSYFEKQIAESHHWIPKNLKTLIKLTPLINLTPDYGTWQIVRL